MGVLAVYDTVGIQNYIFSSNKLSENVGGSKLIADIFNEDLPDIIAKVTKEDIKVIKKWRDGGALNPALKAEIVYQGGGNAFVAFADEPTFQAITKAFLIYVSKTAPGVGIAVAALETDFGETYESDFDKLNKRLTLVKGSFNTAVFAGNQPITKQSRRTGLPVSEFRDGEYLSQSQLMQRERYAVFKKKRNSNIEDFEDLAFEKGKDSFIAIVHVDGNNMGMRIKEYIKQFKNYTDAVPKIRKLVTSIDNFYNGARVRTTEAFNLGYADYIAQVREKFPGRYDNKIDKKGRIIKDYDEPPILDLIGDGDDITLVISGRFALDFAARLLRELEKTTDTEWPFADEPNACAGVVIFHEHYPFSEAYKLVEDLCKSAKKKSRECTGSYIDFHLHQSGNVASLKVLRDRQYKVEGCTLLRRPWRITAGKEDEQPNFKWFENNMALLKNEKDYPRNKIKSIRNAISAGDNAADIAQYQLRGKKLPKITTPLCDKMSKFAAHFDILEMQDIYENLLNKWGGKDA